MPQTLLSDADIGIGSSAPKPLSDEEIGIGQSSYFQERQNAQQAPPPNTTPDPSEQTDDELRNELDTLHAQASLTPNPPLKRLQAVQDEYNKRLNKMSPLAKAALTAKLTFTKAIPEGVGQAAGLIGKGAEALIGKVVGTGDTAQDVEKSVALGQPLPVEQAAENLSPVPKFLAQTGLGMVEAIPKIAALAAVPEALPFQMAASGALFGLDAQGKFHPKEAVIMALMPGVGRLASAGVSRAIASGLETGTAGIKNRFGQKILDTLGGQAAYDAYLTLAESPDLIAEYQDDPKKALAHVAKIVGGNLAWGLLHIPNFRGKVPSATEHFLNENGDKYAKAYEKVFGDALEMPGLEERRAAVKAAYEASLAPNTRMPSFAGTEIPTPDYRPAAPGPMVPIPPYQERTTPNATVNARPQPESTVPELPRAETRPAVPQNQVEIRSQDGEPSNGSRSPVQGAGQVAPQQGEGAVPIAPEPLGANMSTARAIIGMSPTEFRQRAAGSNKWNIELGRNASAADYEELKALRDHATQRMTEARDKAKANPTSENLQDMQDLSVMPQFYNEAIAEYEKRVPPAPAEAPPVVPQTVGSPVSAVPPAEPSAPLPPAQAAAVEAAKPAIEGAPVGAEVNGWRKNEKGRWQKIGEDGNLKGIPAPKKQAASLEEAHARPPMPVDERTPEQILGTAKQVKVKLPAGPNGEAATHLKVELVDGGKKGKSETFVAELNKGDNQFFGSDEITKMEAGHYDRQSKKWVAHTGEIKVEDVGRIRRASVGKPNPVLLALRENLHFNDVAQLRWAVNHEGTPIPPEMRRALSWLLSQKFVDQVPGFKTEIGDYLQGSMRGEYLPDKSLVRFLRFTDAAVPIHEFIHHLERFLDPKDLAYISKLREETIHAELSKARNYAEIQQLEGLLDAPLESDEFVSHKYSEGIYHLSNDHEFLAWLLTEKAVREMNKPEVTGFVGKVRGLIEKLMNWVKDQFGIAPHEDTLWRQILSGKYEFKAEDGMKFEAGSKSRFSLAEDPTDYDLKKLLHELGAQAGTIGGYFHRFTVQNRLATSLWTNERARAMDGLNRARDMTELAQSDAGRLNYYDAWDNADTLGEKNVVIRDARESVDRYQFLGIGIKQRLDAQTELLRSQDFRNRLARASEKRDKAELTAKAKRTFTNHVAAAAGQILQTLDNLKHTGATYDQLRSDYARVQKMADFSQAVANKVNDIIDVLSADDHGISILNVGGSKDGSDLYAGYEARIPLRGDAMPTGDSKTLLKLASSVLAANRDLRNEFTTLNLIAKDVISTMEINGAGSRIAQEIAKNPAEAVKALATRSASLGDKAGRAEAAWRILNRDIQRDLDEWKVLNDANDLHTAVEADPEYKQYTTDVMRDAEGLYIPADVKARTKSGKDSFFENKGTQKLYGPSGREYAIDVGWTAASAGEMIADVTRYKNEIDNWLDTAEHPENANSPSRQFWEERRDRAEKSLLSSAMWNPNAITPFSFGKLGKGAWGMLETFFQGLALPAAKLAFDDTKSFDRVYVQGKGWYTKYQPVVENDLRLAFKSHKGYGENNRGDYQRDYLNNIAWEFRHGRDVQVGDRINGRVVTRQDLNLLTSEGRKGNELFQLMWNAGKIGGASGMQDLPRIVAEYAGGAWGVYKAAELGRNPGTTLQRKFSQHGKDLARNVRSILDGKAAEERKLGMAGPDMTEDQQNARREEIRTGTNKQLAKLFNMPDVFSNWVLGFMRQRSSDALKQFGASPFEEHYQHLTELTEANDPAAPKTIENVLDYLNQNTDAEWTPPKIMDQVFGEMTGMTERLYKTAVERGDSTATVIAGRMETAFTQAWSHDIGPAYFYDYGWVDGGAMRESAADVASFAYNRLMTSMEGLLANMEAAKADIESMTPAEKAQVVKNYRDGKDFRDWPLLEDKISQLKTFIKQHGKWVGQGAAEGESIGITAGIGKRVLADYVGAALTGIRTIGRIAGVALGGSSWKMGNVFRKLDYGTFRSNPAAALSAIISMSKLGVSTFGGWRTAEKGWTPGIPLRLALNIPKTFKAFTGNEGSERLYQSIAALLHNTTDEQFAALSYWNDQKQLGMTPDTPLGLKVANILAAPRTKGGTLGRDAEAPATLAGKAGRIVSGTAYKGLAAIEAGLTIAGTYFPTGFGYNITYDAVGRQAGWYIDMLSAYARRSFDTYEKLGSLGRFNFENLADPKNKLLPWEVLPSFEHRLRILTPGEKPRWLRPDSTNLHLARELFRTSTNIDLQDLLLQYWKRLASTPAEQRKGVHFLAPEEADPVKAQDLAEARARGVISRFVEQTHHAVPSNRPHQLQSGGVQATLPFMGWSSQTLKQLQTYTGKVPFAFEATRDGRTFKADTQAMLMVGAGVSALAMIAFAGAGGDLEVRFMRLIDRFFNRKESTLKTIDEASNPKEAAEISVHYLTSVIPILNSAVNSIFGMTGYRGTTGFNAFAFDKVNALLNYVRGVYRTKDLTYGFTQLAESQIPITETIIENLFDRQGFQNNRNAVRILQKFGPADLVERRASSSVSLPTELTVPRQALSAAIFSGNSKLVAQRAQELVAKATELGRPEPQKLLAQVVSTLNPSRQAFGGLLTEQQRQEAFSRMSDTERELVQKAEKNYQQATDLLGMSSSMTKEDSASNRAASGGSGSTRGTIGTSSLPSLSSGSGGGSGGSGGSLPSGRIRGLGTSGGIGRIASALGGTRRLRTPGRLSRRLGLSGLSGRKGKLVKGRLKVRSGRVRGVKAPRRRRLTHI